MSPEKYAKLTTPIRDLAKCWKTKPIGWVFPSSVRFDELWSFILLSEDSGVIKTSAIKATLTLSSIQRELSHIVF